MRLELSEGWAEIRDPKKVSRGQRKPVRRAALRINKYQADLIELAIAAGTYVVPEEGAEPAKYAASDEEVQMMDDLQETAAVALVSAWSWDLPITRESLDELPADDSDKLVAHCGDLVSEMFADTSPSPDEDSPTTPLSD